MNVSAVIPTFNRRSYIRRALDSVSAQTVPVDEVIVVDDGSTDGTAEAVQSWYGPRVRVVRQERRGVSGARQRGIAEAHGEWIAFLDSDDEWTPERNRALLEAAGRVPPDVAWIFGDLRVVTDKGDQSTLFEEHGLALTDSPHVFADSLSVQYPFQFGMLQGSFIRRKVLLELNCFGAGLQSDDDLFTGFQVACRYRFAAIPAVVGKYFRTSDLEASSVVVNGVYGPDHFRSRMMAFELVIASGRRRPWNELYASEVRGMCQLLAARGPVPRRLAISQFRYGALSAKSVAFLFAAMAGRTGIFTWNKLAELRAKYLRRQSSASATKKNGLQAYIQSIVDKRLSTVE
jgi:glycosyltransferase involved in cell wall biosynthesis